MLGSPKLRAKKQMLRVDNFLLLRNRRANPRLLLPAMYPHLDGAPSQEVEAAAAAATASTAVGQTCPSATTT